MMTIRCRSKLSTLMFCLPLGLCVASTAWGASDDEEDWHDTKGPRGESSKSNKSDSDKSDSDKSDSDKAKSGDKSDSDDKASDGEADTKGGSKRKKKAKLSASTSSTKMSLAALVSYGTADPLQLGVGVRGGVHLDGLLPLYIGGVGQYFFGMTTIRRSTAFGNSDFVRRFVFFGAEAGIDVEATPDIVLRPGFGLGLGFDTNKVCPTAQPCSGGTKLHPTITPGITGLYYLGTFFLGVDLRYLIVPGASTTSGALISATLGLRF